MPSFLLWGSAACVPLFQHVPPNLNDIFHFSHVFKVVAELDRSRSKSRAYTLLDQ